MAEPADGTYSFAVYQGEGRRPTTPEEWRALAEEQRQETEALPKEYSVIHYLSYDESENGCARAVEDHPGYDPTKHFDGIRFMQWPTADRVSTEEGHFEYRLFPVHDQYSAQRAFDERMARPETNLADQFVAVRYLSYEETIHGYSQDETHVAGYDPEKHDLRNIQRPLNTYYTADYDPMSTEQGHFEYETKVEYAESEPEGPTVAAIDSETALDVMLPSGEGLTYIYWEPLDWDSRFAVDEFGMPMSDEDPMFMQVSDMDILWDRTAQGVIGSKTNKIVMTTGTDPALYDVDEWNPSLGRCRLILQRHDSVPVERINEARADVDADDVTVIGAHFEDDGVLALAISDVGWLFRSTNFKIPPGGYRLLVTGSHRRQEDETVTIDMWPSADADEPDEVLKAADW